MKLVELREVGTAPRRPLMLQVKQPGGVELHAKLDELDGGCCKPVRGDRLLRRIRIVAVVAGVLAASPARAEGERFDASTMTAQAIGGGVIAAVSGTATGIAGAGIGYLIDRRSWGGPLAGALIGFSLGASTGLVFGVHYLGDERGGNGSPLGTLIGFGVGVVAFGAVETIAERARWRMPAAVRAVEAIVFLIGGPVIGYHVTNRPIEVGPDVSFRLPLLRF